MAWEWEIGIVTCVCSRVRPRIHRICPARGFLSESGSNFSSPRLIALISSGWPRPHLFLKNMKLILHHSIPVTHRVYNQSRFFFFFFFKRKILIFFFFFFLRFGWLMTRRAGSSTHCTKNFHNSTIFPLAP